jgi:3-isopropylmalate/(R)-2-methylmalate dehydratase small subunit
MMQGRVWKFGDNISTDLMMPGSVLFGTEAEQRASVFAANRPGWIKLVREGDFIVGGQNYGVGSSRPAALQLKRVGVRCLIAESINGLFLRNCVNFGLPAFECVGVHEAFEEGQHASVSTDTFVVRNVETGKELSALPFPPMLLDLMLGGGIFPKLEASGLVSKLPEGQVERPMSGG